jgi:hypothetical protein
MMDVSVIRLLRSVFILLALHASTQGAEHPKWQELTALLGKRYDAAEVTSVVRKHGLRSAIKFDSGQFSPLDQSYTILFREGKVSDIFLRIALWPRLEGMTEWIPYSRPLPAGLTGRDTRVTVIKKLGPPVPGPPATDRGKNTWVADGRRIWVIFQDEEGPIVEMFLSAHTDKEGKRDGSQTTKPK